ncbi:spectrin beta chain isoform X5 [Ixodes scapularis]
MVVAVTSFPDCQALELEIDTYSGLIVEMTHQGQTMIDQSHPDSKIIANQMHTVNQEMKNLQRLSNARRQRLMEAKHTHEFFRESDELEDWISEQTQAALSEDYGKDYEHLLVLQAKFEDRKLVVDTGEKRLEQCADLGRRLITAEVARSGEIERRLDRLDEALASRDQKLQAAGEIHRFNRDVGDALSRIQEKYAAIPEETGKDLDATQGMVRRQEGFENDLVALEAQLQVLVDDSVRLQAAYPGGNAEHIAEQQRLVVDQWSALQDKVARRKEQLKESLQFQKFLSMAMEDELAAHEQQLMEVVRAGESLVAEGQPGSERVSQRTAEVLSAWDHLRELQALRAQRLAQALDFHQFFADADDVDTWMLDTLMLVSSDDVGRDEANVQSLLKKHKDVMEELKSYTGAIDALHAQADALGPADRESPAVLERLASIDHRYKDLLDLARLRKQRLLDALSLHKLFNEADGVHQWIQEKDKMLESMVLTRDAEDTEVMRHRFEGFEQEMNGSASRVAVVNQLARQLLHVEHPNSEQVLEKQNALNQSWAALRDAAEKKRENISSAHGVQTFHVECRETITWIEEKTKLLQATEDLGDDLTGIMTLQRRLSGMERDLAAIQAKLDALDKEAERIKQEHPEEADAIQERILQIKTVWEQLTQLLKERDAKLEEAGDLHRFLRDLDHFQAWLTKTQTEIASEDEPTSLQEAERLLEQHRLIRQEVDNYTDDYAKMMEYGERITADAADEDPQYMFLRERLRALRDGWAELTQMWENRQALLSQSLNLQLFQRDAKQAEVLLSRQEHHLSKDETPNVHWEKT